MSSVPASGQGGAIYILRGYDQDYVAGELLSAKQFHRSYLSDFRAVKDAFGQLAVSSFAGSGSSMSVVNVSGGCRIDGLNR